MAKKFAPISLEKLFERRNVDNIIGGENEMERIFRLAVDDISRTIKRLQKKQLTDPSKYGNQLLRNKELKRQLLLFRDDLNKKLGSQLKSEINQSWSMANQKNDILVNDYLKGLDVGSAANYTQVNSKALTNFINRKTKGLGLSDKVWNMSNDTKALVEDWIGTGITQGKSAAKISSEMFRMMGDPNAAKVINDAGETIRFNKVSEFLRTPALKGHYKNPRKSIKRLVRNEINKSYRDSDHTRFQQLDFVVGKEVHLSAAHADFDVCDNLAGKYPKTFIFDGWHPNCLCYVTSILMTKEEFKNGTTTNESKNFIKRVPVKTERLVKTINQGKVQVKGASSFENSDWFKKNFRKGKPMKKVGGNNPKVKPYKTRQDLVYDASPKEFLQNAKDDLVTKK